MCTCFAVSVQLQCDRRQIKATIGEELTIDCSYDTRYRYNRKYWCRGSSRKTCEVLSDSVKTQSKHFRILHYRSRRLFVEIRALRLEDTGVYWVGINTDYADIMVSVDIEVTEGKNHTRYTQPLLWTRLKDPNLCPPCLCHSARLQTWPLALGPSGTYVLGGPSDSALWLHPGKQCGLRLVPAHPAAERTSPQPGWLWPTSGLCQCGRRQPFLL